MDVTAAPVAGGGGRVAWVSRRCRMSGIELLSYSRRTPVMPAADDALDETVSRGSPRRGAEPDWRIRANCRVVSSGFPVKTHPFHPSFRPYPAQPAVTNRFVNPAPLFRRCFALLLDFEFIRRLPRDRQKCIRPVILARPRLMIFLIRYYPDARNIVLEIS